MSAAIQFCAVCYWEIGVWKCFFNVIFHYVVVSPHSKWEGKHGPVCLCERCAQWVYCTSIQECLSVSPWPFGFSREEWVLSNVLSQPYFPRFGQTGCRLRPRQSKLGNCRTTSTYSLFIQNIQCLEFNSHLFKKKCVNVWIMLDRGKIDIFFKQFQKNLVFTLKTCKRPRKQRTASNVIRIHVFMKSFQIYLALCLLRKLRAED